MRNGNPDTRRRHVFETAVEMLTETETINLDDLVDTEEGCEQNIIDFKVLYIASLCVAN